MNTLFQSGAQNIPSTAINLEVRWLLNEQTPSNLTISSFRRDNAIAFRQVFRKFVYMLKQANLIGGETIAIEVCAT
ncbi:hypothetical protein MASR1M74_22390 [Lentimicrobium sp.]